MACAIRPMGCQIDKSRLATAGLLVPLRGQARRRAMYRRPEAVELNLHHGRARERPVGDVTDRIRQRWRLVRREDR
jgi:hypothetical protein